MLNFMRFVSILLIAAGALSAQSTATAFAGKADGYQVLGGSLTSTNAIFTGTVDFKIYTYSSTAMHFDLTPHLPSGATLLTVTLELCQSNCNGNPFHYLCGYGPGNPRSVCSQTGYIGSNGGELLASDLLPYGKNATVANVLDYLRHNMVYVRAVILVPGEPVALTIRGQLIPQ